MQLYGNMLSLSVGPSHGKERIQRYSKKFKKIDGYSQGIGMVSYLSVDPKLEQKIELYVDYENRRRNKQGHWHVEYPICKPAYKIFRNSKC